MRMVVLATIAVSAGLFAATSSANAAAYTFTTIDVPGALGSSGAAGINNAGQIVGGFADHAGPHGYLDTGGSFTTIDVPGASSTEALGISNAGQIVGDTQNRGGRPLLLPLGHGFFYSGGGFTAIDVPGALGTSALGINDAGQIVGIFRTSNSSTGDHSFLYANGSFTMLEVPGAANTRASGINDAGQIVGRVDSACPPPFPPGTCIDGIHGFLDAGGTFTTIDVPGAEATEALGINNAGQIVGDFSTSMGLSAFVDTDGSFTTFEVPGSVEGSTIPFGINDAGQIVGVFEVQTGTGIGSIITGHGFLATPISEVPEPSSLALLGVGIIGLGILRRRQHACPC